MKDPFFGFLQCWYVCAGEQIVHFNTISVREWNDPPEKGMSPDDDL
jgi:hypothetical protein